MTNKYFILTAVVLTLITSACAKSPSGVRTIKQTSANTVNAVASSQSVQAAVVQNLYYEVTSVSRPDVNVKVTLEVKTPAGLFLPITTDHSSSREAYGIYKDETNAVQLEFRARCSDDICSKYTLLMTVVKANLAYHQTAVVSYRNDCKFNIENLNAGVTQNLYTSLNAVDTKFDNAGVREVSDCPLDN